MEMVTLKGTQQLRKNVRCRTPVCIYNVSKQPVCQGQILPSIHIPDDHQATTVMRLHCNVEAIPQGEMDTDMRGAIKKELLSHMEPTTLIDLWNWKQNSRSEAMGLVRVPGDKIDALLRLSGKGGLWVETPLQKRHLFAPLWLNKPDAPSTLEQTLQKAAKLTNHYGIIRKSEPGDKYSYAIRVLQTELTASREVLQLDTGQRYHIQGPPAHISTQQIHDILVQMKWEATVQAERRWFRGKPTWQATSTTSPPCNETYVQLGYERCWLRIIPARKQLSPIERVPPHGPKLPARNRPVLPRARLPLSQVRDKVRSDRPILRPHPAPLRAATRNSPRNACDVRLRPQRLGPPRPSLRRCHPCDPRMPFRTR